MTRESTIHELFDLTGRVALVTGATGHLGRSMATALAEAGATVVAASRDERRAVETTAMLPTPQGQRHLGIALDQLKFEDAANAFDLAADAAGGVDILVNAAHDPLSDDWTTVLAEQFNDQLSHATAYFLLARKLRDHAVARGKSASIIMLGSMYGVVGSYPDSYAGVGPANSVAYQTLKGGIVQMTRHLAVYWAKDRIRVNCLSPGPFPRDSAPAELRDRLASKSPMGRLGAPQELKGAVILLASNAGSYITGQNLIVDGGWTAW